MCRTCCSEHDTKKILLQEPQPLALFGLVVGVEHLGDGRGADLVHDRSVVVAGVERLQRERLDRPGGPQRQHVARVHPVPLDRGVVGDALQHPFRYPPDAVVTGVVDVTLAVPAPVDPVVHIRLFDLPRVAVDQPVVGLLDLPAVANLLVEDAELIADAIADGVVFQRGERVQITRSQPAQTAVAQPGLLLAGQDFAEVLAESPERRAGLVFDTEIEQVRAELGPYQEFRRKVARDLSADVQRLLGRRRPVVLHAIPHRQSQRTVVVLGSEGGRRAADRVAQMVDDPATKRVGVHSRTTMARRFRPRGRGTGCLREVCHRASVAPPHARRANV